MVLRCFRKESVLAGFSAEARTPMVVVDETELPPTVCAPVLQLGRETLHRFGGYGTTRYTQATGGQAEACARISASPLAMPDSSTCRIGKRTVRPRRIYSRHMCSDMRLQSEQNYGSSTRCAWISPLMHHQRAVAR